MHVNLNPDLKRLDAEITRVISELRSIALVLTNDFTGIGTDLCGKKLLDLADNYSRIQQQLRALETRR